jgi:hypothetical protein
MNEPKKHFQFKYALMSCQDPDPQLIYCITTQIDRVCAVGLHVVRTVGIRQPEVVKRPTIVFKSGCPSMKVLLHELPQKT